MTDGHDRHTLMTLLSAYYTSGLVTQPDYSLAETPAEGYTAPSYLDYRVGFLQWPQIPPAKLAIMFMKLIIFLGTPPYKFEKPCAGASSRKRQLSNIAYRCDACWCLDVLVLCLVKLLVA